MTRVVGLECEPRPAFGERAPHHHHFSRFCEFSSSDASGRGRPIKNLALGPGEVGRVLVVREEARVEARRDGRGARKSGAGNIKKNQGLWPAWLLFLNTTVNIRTQKIILIPAAWPNFDPRTYVYFANISTYF